MPTPARETTALGKAARTALRTGLCITALLLSAGLLSAALRGEPPTGGAPPAFSEILAGLASADPLSLVDLGLIALIATPVLRVGVLAVGWCLSREYEFAGAACAVLLLLALSFRIGLG